MVDSYIYFIDRGLRLLSKDGLLGYIVPSTLLNQVDSMAVRSLLLDRGLSALVSLGQGIFGSKVLNTSTILVTRGLKAGDALIVANLSTVPLIERPSLLPTCANISWSDWKSCVRSDPVKTFFASRFSETALLSRLREMFPALRDAVNGKIQRGITPDHAPMHVLSPSEVSEKGFEKEVLKPSISGGQIKRYQPLGHDQFLIYTHKRTPIEKYPLVFQHLNAFRHKITCKEVASGKHPWWALHRARDPRIFESPKFIGLTTSRTIALIYDRSDSLFVTDAMYVFRLKPNFSPMSSLGILHSKLFLFLYWISNQGESRVIPQVKASKLNDLPFPQSQDNGIDDEITHLVERLFKLHLRRANAMSEYDKNALQRQIEATDMQIDRLVYAVYGLSDQEIEIVERVVGGESQENNT